MGGLSKGELVSSVLVREMEAWFQYTLPDLVDGQSLEVLASGWVDRLESVNSRTLAYASGHGCQMGSTFSGIFLRNREYFFLHIGDSRIYILDKNIRQLTRDHTLVAREVEQGRLSPEDAATDSRRNVLIQCVGAVEKMDWQLEYGCLQGGESLLLCSDGFRHEQTLEEIWRNFCPSSLEAWPDMGSICRETVERVKQRGERDNISVIVLRSLDIGPGGGAA